MAPRDDAPRITAAVAKGLDRVAGLGVGHGFVEATAGLSLASGAFATVEAGWKPHQAVDLFAFAKADPLQAMAGVGARVTF